MSRIETHNGYLLVEVPGHSTDFDLDYGGRNVICMGEYVDAGYIETPPGPWDILGLASSLSDKDWSAIVEGSEPVVVNEGEFIRYWKDYSYVPNRLKAIAFVNTPTASGLSLLGSMNLKAETTLILKKI